MGLSRDVYARLLEQSELALVGITNDKASGVSPAIDTKLGVMLTRLQNLQASARAALDLDELEAIDAQITALQARRTALGG